MRRFLLASLLLVGALGFLPGASANYSQRDGADKGIWLCSTGAGTTTDPHVPCNFGGPGTLADCSGTITTGGTSQSLIAAATTTRHYLLIQNIGSAQIGLKEGTGASIGVAGTLTIGPGGSLVFEGSFVPQNAFAIVGPTTGQSFTCKQG